MFSRSRVSTAAIRAGPGSISFHAACAAVALRLVDGHRTALTLPIRLTFLGVHPHHQLPVLHVFHGPQHPVVPPERDPVARSKRAHAVADPIGDYMCQLAARLPCPRIAWFNASTSALQSASTSRVPSGRAARSASTSPTMAACAAWVLASNCSARRLHTLPVLSRSDAAKSPPRRLAARFHPAAARLPTQQTRCARQRPGTPHPRQWAAAAPDPPPAPPWPRLVGLADKARKLQ